MHRLVSIAGVVVLSLCAVYLALDASRFALSPADPVRGRARGCYTILDNLIGTKAPVDALRWTEWVLVGGVLFKAWRLPQKTDENTNA